MSIFTVNGGGGGSDMPRESDRLLFPAGSARSISTDSTLGNNRPASTTSSFSERPLFGDRPQARVSTIEWQLKVYMNCFLPGSSFLDGSGHRVRHSDARHARHGRGDQVRYGQLVGTVCDSVIRRQSSYTLPLVQTGWLRQVDAHLAQSSSSHKNVIILTLIARPEVPPTVALVNFTRVRFSACVCLISDLSLSLSRNSANLSMLCVVALLFYFTKTNKA